MVLHRLRGRSAIIVALNRSLDSLRASGLLRLMEERAVGSSASRAKLARNVSLLRMREGAIGTRALRTEFA